MSAVVPTPEHEDLHPAMDVNQEGRVFFCSDATALRANTLHAKCWGLDAAWDVMPSVVDGLRHDQVAGLFSGGQSGIYHFALTVFESDPSAVKQSMITCAIAVLGSELGYRFVVSIVNSQLDETACRDEFVYRAVKGLSVLGVEDPGVLLRGRITWALGGWL